MKIRVTFDLNDHSRRAINNHFGRPGKATYEEVKRWILMVVAYELETIEHDLQKEEEMHE